MNRLKISTGSIHRSIGKQVFKKLRNTVYKYLRMEGIDFNEKKE